MNHQLLMSLQANRNLLLLRNLRKNRHLPFGVLKLITDSRLVWAYNHTTPPEVLEECARDTDWTTRFGVAKNPNTSVATLEVLSQDENHRVHSNALQALMNRLDKQWGMP